MIAIVVALLASHVWVVEVAKFGQSFFRPQSVQLCLKNAVAYVVHGMSPLGTMIGTL